MDKKIARVQYDGFVRYWCFGEKFVEDVYDEVDGVVEQDEYTAWIFNDMTREELENADKGKYEITWLDCLPFA